jgi:hypothetical protein
MICEFRYTTIERRLKMSRLLVKSIFSVTLIVGLASASIAGHNYHGYGMKMSEMSEIDSNNDGEINFDEFSAPTTEKLKNGFDMLDVNNDEVISTEEWDEFLRVHGFEKRSEG